jgi:hypothetical protein
MGTYDTHSGASLSPDCLEEHIFNEEDEALGILEDADVPADVCDDILRIIRKLCILAYSE